MKLNGTALDGVQPGHYLTLDRNWKAGDSIEIDFDFSPYFWRGERECANKVSIYRGPILLTYDRRFNEQVDPDTIPILDAKSLAEKVVSSDVWLPPIILLEFTGTNGRELRLCDFASAGAGGSPYRSWLQVTGVAAGSFSPSNPLRSVRAA